MLLLLLGELRDFFLFFQFEPMVDNETKITRVELKDFPISRKTLKNPRYWKT